jgi:NAD(P)-dependent dehydrogenase (short-subunit alcohol dehydrogenase family)
MYKVVSIAPLMIASGLYNASLFANPSKFILITSEGGSIALRTRQEGSGNYGHHSSKAAANMIGKLLANEWFEKGITVGLIHPGFMKTEMTKGVGFDKFYESGGAVEPSEAAETTISFVLNELPHDITGSFWAPRGPNDIGEANRVLAPIMGKDLPTPLPLPW